MLNIYINIKRKMNDTISASKSGSTGSGSVKGGYNTEIEVGVSASAGAGVKDGNAHAGVHFMDGARAEVGTTGSVGDKNIGGVNGGASIEVKSGTFVDASVVAGKNGVNAEGGASLGSSVEVGAGVGMDSRYSGGSVGAGVSIGEQLGASGGVTATAKDGKLTLGVQGDVAALVGVDADVKVDVNYGTIAHDVTSASHSVTDAAHTATNAVSSTAKKTGKAIKKTFKL